MSTKLSEVQAREEKRKAYHRKWQNEQYAKNEKFRAMKKRNAVQWKLKHLARYKKYHEAYRKKMREERGKGSL